MNWPIYKYNGVFKKGSFIFASAAIFPVPVGTLAWLLPTGEVTC